MNRLIINVIAAVVLLFLGYAPALAVSAPHNYQCIQCHVSHNKLGDQALNNVCLTCHNYSGGARAQSYPFATGDAANPFNPAPGAMQTSHNWSGSDTNPQAGAQPPTNPALARPSVAGVMACSKCHNLHGPLSGPTNSAPFLRGLNDQDQMCLDCHRSRNQQSHVSGTHPVAINYTTVIKKYANYTSLFYMTPLSANPANPTATVKLANGQVVCSTCHAVHYADSDSSTFDNHSSALLGLLNPSAGFLLRTDYRGATTDTINICTNCHKGKLGHNISGQNVQCTDCHGTHVDYIKPEDVAAGEGTPNTFLLRRYVNYSAGVKLSSYRRKAFFSTSSATASTMLFRIGNGKGICEACHTPPQTIAEHSVANYKSQCALCHTTPHGAANVICGSCHGMPPQANSGGYPGYAVDSSKGNNYSLSPLFKDESQTPHITHAGGAPYSYGCTECHKGNTHDSGTFQDLFNDKTGIIAATAGSNPSYNGSGNGSCANVYCHSNGAPAGQPIKFRNPAWGLAKGSIAGTAGECVSCHGGVTGGFNNLSTNAHFRHVSNDPTTGRNFGCVTCHGATVSTNNTISDQTKHVNGTKDIKFVEFAAGVGWTGTSCTTNYCHSNGKGVYATPVWTNRASGACGTCHNTTPPMGGALVNSGAHFTHFSTSSNSYGPMLTQQNATSCQTCHNYSDALGSNHVNRSVDFSDTLGYSPAGTGTCTPCHNQPVSWTGGPVACESCHTGTLALLPNSGGVTAPDKSLEATLGHGKPGIGRQCLDCHDRNKRHITPDRTNSRLQDYLSGSLNTQCKYCHDNAATVQTAGFRNMSTHFTVKGGSQAMACAQCHDLHGTTNLSMIRETIKNPQGIDQGIAYNDRATEWVDTSTNLGLCQVCHTQTNHYKAGVPETSHPSANCFNCHTHNASGGAFKPTGGSCDACHGYPPAPRSTTTAVTFGTMNNWSSARFEDYSGGGGAHLVGKHISPDAKPSEGWANCAICHNGGRTASAPYHQMVRPVGTHISNVHVEVDPQYRFSPGFIVYTGAKQLNPPARNVTGSCFNVSCHFVKTPQWSIER